MTLYIDANLPPSLAPWLKEKFNIDSFSFDQMMWRFSEDHEIFMNLQKNDDSIVVTKDEDFINLLDAHGAPPKIIWVTIGNTSNQNLRTVFLRQFKEAISLLKDNDLVEISG